MAAFVFSVFGAQPLCIAGVTGPITVLNKTIFDITQQGDPSTRPNYLHLVGWVYLWAAILHWTTAILNCMYHVIMIEIYPAYGLFKGATS
jgi:boron transporter